MSKNFEENRAFTKAFTPDNLDKIRSIIHSVKENSHKEYVVMEKELIRSLINRVQLLDDVDPVTICGLYIIQKDPLYNIFDRSNYIPMNWEEYEDYCTIVKNMKKLVDTGWLNHE